MRTPKKRILLVEDDGDNRDGLAEALGERYEVVEAASAEEGLSRLEQERFDLLLTDYRLRGATGTWLARMAVNRGHLAASQTLIITAFERLHDADGLEVLRKPLTIGKLLARVDDAVATLPIQWPVSEPCHRISLVLYVNDSLASLRAVRNLRALLSQYSEDQVALMTVDISRRVDHHAEEDRVVATPTLVRTFPAPRVWVTGDLKTGYPVERLLEEAGVERSAELPSMRASGQSS
jgi:CheY-like chemotaxis protein